MKKKRLYPSKFICSLCLLLVSVLCVAPAAFSKSADQNIDVLSAKACPAKKLQATQEFSAHKGQWLYVDFWASWCGPCRDTFPFMNELQKEYGDKLTILAISVDEDKTDADKFLKAFPATFPTYIDTKGVCPETFKVKGMPSSYLISPEGKIVFAKTGFKKKSPQQVRAVLKKHIK